MITFGLRTERKTERRPRVTIKIPTPTLIDRGGYSIGHYVDLDVSYLTVKEEVRMRFLTSWRGQQVIVTMEVSRYSVSTSYDSDPTRASWKLTDWRMFAEGAREWRPETPPEGQEPKPFAGYCGNELTDTARKALGKACEPLAWAWMNSPAFEASRKESMATRIKGMLGRAHVWSEQPTHNVQRALERHKESMHPQDHAALLALCVELESFSEKFRKPLPSGAGA